MFRARYESAKHSIRYSLDFNVTLNEYSSNVSVRYFPQKCNYSLRKSSGEFRKFSSVFESIRIRISLRFGASLQRASVLWIFLRENTRVLWRQGHYLIISCDPIKLVIVSANFFDGFADSFSVSLASFKVFCNFYTHARSPSLHDAFLEILFFSTIRSLSLSFPLTWISTFSLVH